MTVLLGPLRKARADGVDGRQVEDVEAHGGDVGSRSFDVGEGAVAGGVGRGGAGKSSYQLEKRARSRSTQRCSSWR